jgi:hypothetical protein
MVTTRRRRRNMNKMHRKNYIYGKWKMKIGSVMKYAWFHRSDGLV